MAYSRMSGRHRGEAEAAVADGDRRDAVPARQGAVRIPEDLGVVVRVQVDEARRNVHTGRVDDAGSRRGVDTTHRHDLSALDGDVATSSRRPGPVEDQSVFDNDVVVLACHQTPPCHVFWV